MTSNEVGAVEVVGMDPVMLEVQKTGRLPQAWWASTGCWAMLAKLCGQLSGSSMVPSDFRKNPENVLVAMPAICSGHQW